MDSAVVQKCMKIFYSFRNHNKCEFSSPDFLSLPLPFLPLDCVEASVSCRYQCRTENTRGGITQNEKKEGEKSLYGKNRIYNELSQYLPLLRGERENRVTLGGRVNTLNGTHFL